MTIDANQTSYRVWAKRSGGFRLHGSVTNKSTSTISAIVHYSTHKKDGTTLQKAELNFHNIDPDETIEHAVSIHTPSTGVNHLVVKKIDLFSANIPKSLNSPDASKIIDQRFQIEGGRKASIALILFLIILIGLFALSGLLIH